MRKSGGAHAGKPMKERPTGHGRLEWQYYVIHRGRIHGHGKELRGGEETRNTMMTGQMEKALDHQMATSQSET